jgi:amino acid transporter|tara:strand:- start:323 stop:784 length:462 start_codon:yes stop_codon:yes gene_type:complete
MKISRSFLLWWVQTVAICFASFFIYTFEWFDALYNSDQTKISFLIITIFIIASVTVGYLSYRNSKNFNKLSNYVWFSSETMVTLGLIGTVAGFLLMLSSAFDNLDVKNVENVQEVITDMSLGMSTALCTTLVGLVCSVLTKIQMVILENNQDV